MRGVLLAAVAVLCVIPSAAATHMGWYAQFPVEHDDQGRSEEPDGARTGVLGVEVRNCVIGTSLTEPGCTPEPVGEGPLAPGCTDDSGRRPSGLCGIWTVGVGHPWVVEHEGVPPQTVGFGGPGCAASPGAFTRGCRAVRFLDIQANAQFYAPTTPGTSYVQLNRKLSDSGASPALADAGLDVGDAILGDTALWAWYGVWLDKDGNGVIDHLGDHEGKLDERNEFVWIGNCQRYLGEPPPPGQEYCRPEASTFPVWVWPGNHHAYCGASLIVVGGREIGCSLIAADLPGREAACFPDVVASALGVGGLPIFCPAEFDDFDHVERGYYGDPLLGEQGDTGPDGAMEDRTGDPDIALRHWLFGPGWAMRFYDQSALVSTVVVGGPTSQRGPTYDFRSFHALDVDHYRALHPATDALLQGQVKPALRSHWLLLRDNFVPLTTWADGVRNGAALDTSGPAAPAEDALLDPGWSREPNTPWDRYPAAAFDVHEPSDELPAAEQRHRGWLNDYSGHVGAWHAFGDVTGRRMFPTSIAWRHPLGSNCPPIGLCSYYVGGYTTSAQPLSPDLPGEHRRTMEPGLWQFGGVVGAWRDTPHVLREEVWDPLRFALTADRAPQVSVYTTAPDGWVGNIVNTTATWRYRGYPTAADPGAPTCTIAGVTARRDFAACNPYWNGATVQAGPYGGPFQDPGVDLEDPQTWGSSGSGREFVAPFPEVGPWAERVIRVYPGADDGCERPGAWTVPVAVWRNFFHWPVGETGAVEDHTGRAGEDAVIVLRAGTSQPLARDLLLLPEGNLGLTVCTALGERVVVALPGRGIVVDEPLRDVDVYAPWGPATP